MTSGMREFLCAAGLSGYRVWLPAVAVVLSAASLQAGIITWTNAAGGDFQTPGNWNSNQVPGQSDVAKFSITSDPHTVTWSQSRTNSSFRVERGDLTFDLQGQTWGYTNGFTIGIVPATSADVRITNGVVTMTNNVIVSSYIDATGTVVTLRNAQLWTRYLNMRGLLGPAADCVTLIVDGPGALVDIEMIARLGYFSGVTSYGWARVVVTNGGVFRTKNNSILIPAYSPGCVWVEVSGSNSIVYTTYSAAGQGIGSAGSGTGIVSLANGGTYALSNADINVYSAGSVILNNGILSTRNGAGYVTNSGLVEGTGRIMAKQFANLGMVRPGGSNAVGALTVRGSFTNTYAGTNGTIAIELGGTAANEYDQLIVTNRLFAGGTLTVSLINGFQPADGDTFKILNYGSVTGVFDTITFAQSPARWDTRALYTTGEIRFFREGTTFFVR